MKQIRTFYRQRFPESVRLARRAMWKTLCQSVFQHYIRSGDTVMDIGAGYCEFINTIVCRKKIAVDVNPDTKRMAAKGVTVVASDASAIGRGYDGTVDVVFMSNFLEHLPTKDMMMKVLARSHTVLRRGGTIIILQPNITLVKERYWDFIDHQIAVNGASMKEALSIAGFEVMEYTERFLPYTTKGNLPTWSWLLWIYLHICPILRPFAGQSLFVARAR